jgi:hypothetical protein
VEWAEEAEAAAEGQHAEGSAETTETVELKGGVGSGSGPLISFPANEEKPPETQPEPQPESPPSE